MFYDIYLALCREQKKSASAVASALGINKSNVSNWKNNGYTPRGEVLNRIAEYFGVTVDYLLGRQGAEVVQDGRAKKDLLCGALLAPTVRDAGAVQGGAIVPAARGIIAPYERAVEAPAPTGENGSAENGGAHPLRGIAAPTGEAAEVCRYTGLSRETVEGLHEMAMRGDWQAAKVLDGMIGWCMELLRLTRGKDRDAGG